MCQLHRFGINIDCLSSNKNNVKVISTQLEDFFIDFIDDNNLFISFEELGLTLEDINNPENYIVVGDNELNDNIVLAKTKIVNLYRYISDDYGSSNIGTNSRKFCKDLVRRSETAMLTKDSIEKLNSSNPGFGKGGSDTYSIFNWRGGVHCKHFWVKYFYQPDTKNLVKAPTSEQPLQQNKGDVPYYEPKKSTK